MPQGAYFEEYPITPDLAQVVGQGIQFPFEFSSVLGTVVVTNERDVYKKAHQDMHMVLATRCYVRNVCSGERFFNQNFGSRLPLLVFEQNDQFLFSELVLWTKDALQKWVPYLSIGRVEMDESTLATETAHVIIPYEIKGSNLKNVFTYPFRRHAGGLLKVEV